MIQIGESVCQCASQMPATMFTLVSSWPSHWRSKQDLAETRELMAAFEEVLHMHCDHHDRHAYTRLPGCCYRTRRSRDKAVECRSSA